MKSSRRQKQTLGRSKAIMGMCCGRMIGLETGSHTEGWNHWMQLKRPRSATPDWISGPFFNESGWVEPPCRHLTPWHKTHPSGFSPAEAF